MRIKEGDKQKILFLILESTFEPMIMFFGLKNLLATFQIMMNDLFRDMIEVRDMVAFINNVIVGTETEKEHDDIMEKVLRRMVENN